MKLHSFKQSGGTPSPFSKIWIFPIPIFDLLNFTLLFLWCSFWQKWQYCSWSLGGGRLATLLMATIFFIIHSILNIFHSFPPKNVLPNKIWYKKNCGSKKNLWVQKCFGPEKNLCLKKFAGEKKCCVRNKF